MTERPAAKGWPPTPPRREWLAALGLLYRADMEILDYVKEHGSTELYEQVLVRIAARLTDTKFMAPAVDALDAHVRARLKQIAREREEAEPEPKVWPPPHGGGGVYY